MSTPDSSSHHVQRASLRVVLDTNVWRWLQDAGAVDEFRQLSKRAGAQVLIPPAVVFEQLREVDDARRQRLVEATTRTSWTRMMPEAWVQCEETIAAVRRHRPQWILTVPPAPAVKRRRANEYDWRRVKGGWWERARRSSVLQAQLNKVAATTDLPELEDQARELNAMFKSMNTTLDTVNLTSTDVANAGVWFTDGSRSSLPRWALESALHITRRMRETSGTYRDWLDPYIPVERTTDDREWLRFWAEVEPAAAPSSWLSWAGRVVCSVSRINSGTAVDGQLFGYMHLADFFASGDKRLVRAADIARSSAPFRVAEAVRIRPETVVNDLRSLVQQ